MAEIVRDTPPPYTLYIIMYHIRQHHHIIESVEIHCVYDIIHHFAHMKTFEKEKETPIKKASNHTVCRQEEVPFLTAESGSS